MDLFASAGVELPRSGGPGARRPSAPRSLRVPLFAYKVVEEARRKAAFTPTAAQRAAAIDYARRAKRAFGKLKEVAVRPIFISSILETVLGYKSADPDSVYSLAYERPIRRGVVDVALGRFHDTEGLDEIIAPFELKGPTTLDLDAPMPGRGRSPVQQAWDYAIDAPGAQWVLISNCLEIRLYGFGRGRDAYEVFDLTRLDEEEEHARLCLLLSADRLLGGALDELLRDTDGAYKDVTERLYVDYKTLRETLIDFMVHSADGPKLSALAAIEPAQKILDRILFIAFAQRTDLLPMKLLERAATARNEFDPRPVWGNFAALFRAVDKGDVRLNIWPYNGGLFALDPLVDGLVLPDELTVEVAKLAEWDYRSEAPVTLLGHVFEQSITDLERLKAAARGEPEPPVGKRKREGVVYTPDMVTRFLVEKTVGVSLREAFDAAFSRHGMGEGASADAQRAFWREYLERLRDFTILDPACGSGAFLVAAFDALAAEYARADKALAALGETLGFDIFDEIVGKNLHDVDLNAESVEITRLSLWLKTARRDHRLQNLEATIRVGDSLIEDAAYTARPFDWKAAFPQIFERGGFDVVIGNPPYVRMELIKAVKPYLDGKYVVGAKSADLYAYFFERGGGLVKADGRLGYISSSTFFRTSSGEALRTFIKNNFSVESVVDFGDAQIFEGVTTYPATLTMRKGQSRAEHVSYLILGNELPSDLIRSFDETSLSMPRSRLSSAAWTFQGEPKAILLDKIAGGRLTLAKAFGAPLRGVLTGLNEAFIIDRRTRDRLVHADPSVDELILPFLRGENIKRWHTEPEELWLINIEFGWTMKTFGKEYGEGPKLPEEEAWRLFCNRFPVLGNHLAQFAERARKRLDKGQFWWELRACTYGNEFRSAK
jgi:hypothetical protein